MRLQVRGKGRKVRRTPSPPRGNRALTRVNQTRDRVITVQDVSAKDTGITHRDTNGENRTGSNEVRKPGGSNTAVNREGRNGGERVACGDGRDEVGSGQGGSEPGEVEGIDHSTGGNTLLGLQDLLKASVKPNDTPEIERGRTGGGNGTTTVILIYDHDRQEETTGETHGGEGHN